MAISPDDPGLYDYIGVAMDWFYVLMETDVEPSQIYLLLNDSIEHSSIKEIRDNSQQYLQILRDDLDAFFSDLPEVCPADNENNNQDQ
ncbi:adenosine/AMP deaminase family protein (macronuclear) [Tetrahymena thermophila SB210]|uniref:Adenosine/AMP deaminase family protein n=1 Tax=Tetrahymena thermophila (strain SB210) TaxID=312017 RepID=Q232T5_TETTS|nr:adenosine/AMP deaminase family protein [Tetrahymena thermophila SB210]EAR91550.2 adenosine/AMP deaminase family protein [Tetrahymena thermophila SB210]|eukprot:XP_001011795.2 adenosine/AMP deaminase family protein [Tetrahymena thermophila SB210]